MFQFTFELVSPGSAAKYLDKKGYSGLTKIYINSVHLSLSPLPPPLYFSVTDDDGAFYMHSKLETKDKLGNNLTICSYVLLGQRYPETDVRTKLFGNF